MVALDAIERAGAIDGESIRAALTETKDFEGVTGVINFDENGDADKSMAVIKTVMDGKFQFLQVVEIQ
jgi:branched-chain amino acid transport system substrate-binding protein